MSPPGVFRTAEGARAVMEPYDRALKGWAVSHTPIVLPTRHGETFVLASGPTSAPPLGLLDGAQANLATWMFDAPVGRQMKLLLKAAPRLRLGSWGRRRLRQSVVGPPSQEVPEGVRSRIRLLELVGQGILHALQMPIVAILGGRDVMIGSKETRDRLSRCAPRARVAFQPDARHFIPGQGAASLTFLQAPPPEEGLG